MHRPSNKLRILFLDMRFLSSEYQCQHCLICPTFEVIKLPLNEGMVFKVLVK